MCDEGIKDNTSTQRTKMIQVVDWLLLLLLVFVIWLLAVACSTLSLSPSRCIFIFICSCIVCALVLLFPMNVICLTVYIDDHLLHIVIFHVNLLGFWNCACELQYGNGMILLCVCVWVFFLSPFRTQNRVLHDNIASLKMGHGGNFNWIDFSPLCYVNRVSCGKLEVRTRMIE